MLVKAGFNLTHTVTNLSRHALGPIIAKMFCCEY